MSNKLRLTGFSRFLLALVFIIPISLLVSRYINNDGHIDWENWRNWLGDQKQEEVPNMEKEELSPSVLPTQNVTALRDSIVTLEALIEQRDSQISALEQRLDLVQYLQNQIDSLNNKTINTQDTTTVNE